MQSKNQETGKNQGKIQDQPINISEFRQNSSDTGSSEVQVAQITYRLKTLAFHFKKHKKDYHSQTGLIKMISRRKKLLSYLKQNSFEKYQLVVRQLGLRK